MTQELANQLIAHYEMGIRKINKMRNIENIDKFLSDSNLENGICACMKYQFKQGEAAYFDEWIMSLKKGYMPYITVTTMYVVTKSEKLACLKFRLDVLKTFKE